MGKWLPLVGLGLAVLAVGLAKDGRFLQENEIGGADQEDDGEGDREELLARELIGNQVELLVNRSGVDVAELIRTNNGGLQNIPSERLRLRDIIGRSQLQYIDYKVEYGLRYDPKLAARQSQPPRSQPPVASVSYGANSIDESDIKADSSIPLVVVSTGGNRTWFAVKDNVTTFASSPVQNVMRPPTRVEQTLDLLGDRLKKLLLNSFVPNSTESRVIEKLKSPLTLFSLFNVVNFENAPCVARQGNLGSPLQGICYHEVQCSQLGGVPMDVCAGGFGVCCVFQLGCNDQTAQNISYFQSPGYPTAVRTKLTCSLTVALRWNTRQVLLELIFFEMGPPREGNCLEDQLIVTVQNTHRTYPILCGINSGQHLYLQVDREYSHFLYLTAVSNSDEPKAFNIRIIQLSELQAPEGCLQYFTGVNGYIKSFNYDDHSVLVTRREPGYLNNLNYAICIRRTPNFCSTTFSNVNEYGEENAFQLVNYDEDGASLTRPGTAGVEIYNCPDDFVALNYLRLCGERLNDGATSEDYGQNAPVVDDSGGPIVVPFRSNEELVGRGFKLMYKQEICQS
ncbi:uncharacterized protein LOC120429171 [Culex pipiens pallens]|uniref:uncharacterized protein LOC120429171 n=1 Tax=Culex pipiens pallens TaxID=42434 RepID=UPI0019538511|nr:uncharacterized protein LOC120429171 [Culex pipiens pallens]